MAGLQDGIAAEVRAFGRHSLSAHGHTEESRSMSREPRTSSFSAVDRRTFTAGAITLAAAATLGDVVMASPLPADLILRNGRVPSFDRATPNASAVAIREGLILAVGDDN